MSAQTDGHSEASHSMVSKDITIPLAFLPHTTFHVRLTRLTTSILVFLTAADPSSPTNTSALGSFVYAMPNRFDPTSPLCTPLVTVDSSLEMATRVAKVLARRAKVPAFVGCSAVLPIGVSMEEELKGFKAVVGAVMEELGKGVNGVSK